MKQRILMQLPENMTRQKQCKRCKFVYKGSDVDIAFRVVKKLRGIPLNYSRICKPCEQDNRTAKTRENRWRAKAINTRRSHSRRLNIPIKDLEIKHGWNIDTMSENAAFSYQNGCPECHEPFRNMGNGLSDITLDIWDKRIEPDYDGNSRWMCSTCNKAKGDMTPDEWVTYKRLFRERDAFLIEQSMLPKLEQLRFL